MEFDGPMDRWTDEEGAESLTKVKESLLKRYYQLHKNEHQQVFVIENGTSIAMLYAYILYI